MALFLTMFIKQNLTRRLPIAARPEAFKMVSCSPSSSNLPTAVSLPGGQRFVLKFQIRSDAFLVIDSVKSAQSFNYFCVRSFFVSLFPCRSREHNMYWTKDNSCPNLRNELQCNTKTKVEEQHLCKGCNGDGRASSGCSTFQGPPKVNTGWENGVEKQWHISQTGSGMGN